MQENSPLSASTNRPRSSVEQTQQSSVSSIEPNDSGGTNGGKQRNRRSLENLVDVVGIEDVVKSTDSQTNNELKHEFKRILVNISIATDEGLGTHNLQVYQLHVAVPLPTLTETKQKDITLNQESNENAFYAYALDENPMELIQRPIEWQAGNLVFKSNDEITTTESSSIDTSSIESSSIDEIQNDSTTINIMTVNNEWLHSGSYEENELLMTSTTDQSINMSQSFPPHYIELPKGERSLKSSQPTPT